MKKKAISRSISKRRIFRSLTDQNVNKYVALLIKQFQQILNLNEITNFSYDLIRQVFYYCKSKILRFKTGRKITINKISMETKRI